MLAHLALPLLLELWSPLVVEAIGDVDEDDSPDVLVGLPEGYDRGDAGVVQVRSGADGRLLHEVRGSRPWERFGHALASAGDLDGDGVDDFVVGAPGIHVGFLHGAPRVGEEGRVFLRGRILLVSGADGGLLAESEASRLQTGFGSALAVLPGAAGETRLAVGSPGFDWAVRSDSIPEPTHLPSQARVGGSPQTLLLLEEGSLSATHERAGYGASFAPENPKIPEIAMTSLSDVDDDGFVELAVAISETRPECAGSVCPRVELIHSPSGAALWSRSLEGAAGLGSLGSLPDIDGDGVRELVVGMHLSSRLDVLSGNDGALLWKQEFRHSQRGMCGYGSSIATVADLDEDGVPEVLVASFDPLYIALGAEYEQELWCYSGRTGEHLGSFREQAEGLQGVGLGRADGTSLVVVGVIDETPRLLAFPAKSLAKGEVRRADVDLAWSVDLLPTTSDDMEPTPTTR